MSREEPRSQTFHGRTYGTPFLHGSSEQSVSRECPFGVCNQSYFSFFPQLSQEIKLLMNDIDSINFPSQSEAIVCNGFIQTHDNKLEKMFVEDLAAVEPLSDDTLLEVIRNRSKTGSNYSFIGDVLLSMNPNKICPTYDNKVSSGCPN